MMELLPKDVQIIQKTFSVNSQDLKKSVFFE